VKPDAYRDICRQHLDLVAVYESPAGELALLIDDTLLPPASPRGRRRWLAETRAAAARIGDDLRGAGFRGPIRIVQYQPCALAAEIVAHWCCRYDRRMSATGPQCGVGQGR